MGERRAPALRPPARRRAAPAGGGHASRRDARSSARRSAARARSGRPRASASVPATTSGRSLSGFSARRAVELRERAVGDVRPCPTARSSSSAARPGSAKEPTAASEEYPAPASSAAVGASGLGNFGTVRSARGPAARPSKREGGGRQRGDLPQPVDRAVHEPVHAGGERSRGDGSGRAGRAPVRGARRPRARAATKPEEERAADEAGLRERPQSEAVRVERLLACSPFSDEVDREVVDADAEQRMVGELRRRPPATCRSDPSPSPGAVRLRASTPPATAPRATSDEPDGDGCRAPPARRERERARRYDGRSGRSRGRRGRRAEQRASVETATASRSAPTAAGPTLRSRRRRGRRAAGPSDASVSRADEQEQRGERTEPSPAQEDETSRAAPAGHQRAAALGEERQLSSSTPAACEQDAPQRPVDLAAGRRGPPPARTPSGRAPGRVLVTGRGGKPIVVEGRDALRGERGGRRSPPFRPRRARARRTASRARHQRRANVAYTDGVEQRPVCAVPGIAADTRPGDREEAPRREGGEQPIAAYRPRVGSPRGLGPRTTTASSTRKSESARVAAVGA